MFLQGMDADLFPACVLQPEAIRLSTREASGDFVSPCAGLCNRICFRFRQRSFALDDAAIAKPFDPSGQRLGHGRAPSLPQHTHSAPLSSPRRSTAALKAAR